MNNNKIKLGDVISTIKGFAFKSKWYCDRGIPIVKVSNFTEDSISSVDLTYIPEEIAINYKKVVLHEHDIIIQTVGSWPNNPNSVVGKVIRVPKYLSGALLNQNAVKIIPNKSLDKRYLFYALRDDSFKKYIIGTAQGSANQASITLHAIKEYYINYFDVEYQKRIATILGAFDDLVEVNLRRIGVLEEVARLLYEEWFVHLRYPGHEDADIIKTPHGPTPKGWKWCKLGDIVSNIKQTERPGQHLHNLFYIPIDCIQKKSLFLNEKKNWEEAKSSLIRFQKNDILFGAMRPYFHKVTVAPFEGITRTTCFILRPNKKDYLSFALMTVFQETTINYANSRSSGSTIPYAIWENGLEDMPLLVPDENTISKFNEIISPMLDEIKNMHFQITNIRQIRDLLLPKLILGEIDVTNIDIQT
jgi:type I restriction enzyme S subunit